jgi:site-specific DNA-methyltransferase (adenine-specific)
LTAPEAILRLTNEALRYPLRILSRPLIDRVINIIKLIVYQRWINLTTNLPRSTIPTGALTGAAIDGRHNPQRPELAGPLPKPVFRDPNHHIKIYQGDCLEILAAIPAGCVDLIFADPPYFLSNDGITCHAGKMVSVNKGAWDKSKGPDLDHEFNRAWLAACQRVLKPNGTIWVSGTSHVIHSVGFAMQQLGMKLLNDISWVKPNPPPNLSCRYFTHATETIIWAAKNKRSRHTFNYQLMREMADQYRNTTASVRTATTEFGSKPPTGGQEPRCWCHLGMGSLSKPRSFPRRRESSRSKAPTKQKLE